LRRPRVGVTRGGRGSPNRSGRVDRQASRWRHKTTSLHLRRSWPRSVAVGQSYVSTACGADSMPTVERSEELPRRTGLSQRPPDGERMTFDFSEIDALIDQLADDGEIAPSTRANHGVRWAVFERWYGSKGVSALPAAPSTVSAFYAALANGTHSDHGEPCSQSYLNRPRFSAATLRVRVLGRGPRSGASRTLSGSASPGSRGGVGWCTSRPSRQSRTRRPRASGTGRGGRRWCGCTRS